MGAGDLVQPVTCSPSLSVRQAPSTATTAARPPRPASEPTSPRCALATTVGLDAARPDAVERRRRTGQRTARENVDDLLDPGSLVEYGPLVIAAQRRRRELQDLIERTPADGLVGGIGTVGGQPVVVMSYDYTVLAGTQGLQNHRKKDRLFEVAERQRLPVVFFTEGGGGRPGDTDGTGVSGLDCLAFNLFGRLSGLVPLVGITSGRCFAGNAAILGCCDVVIATEGSNIGMGGPAMVEGGGLGVFPPEAIGPMDVQVPNGVVDVAVRRRGRRRRRRPGSTSPTSRARSTTWDGARPRGGPRGSSRRTGCTVYDVRAAVDAIADVGSVLELRPPSASAWSPRWSGSRAARWAWSPTTRCTWPAPSTPTAPTRRLASSSSATPSTCRCCSSATRPGIMVGPEAEQTALVRHVSRLFVTGANVTVPTGTIILRKGYGLGAQAMAGGSFKAPLFCVAWPTGELGGMGLEGAVRLGYRKELEAIDDPDERERTFQEMVDRMYTHGKAVNAASHFEIDDVIDPADSRRWISTTFGAAPPPRARTGKKRPNIDTW